MSFYVQTTEFSVKAVMTNEAKTPPTVYDYEIGDGGVLISTNSGEFLQLYTSN
jgi:hypothetical protein